MTLPPEATAVLDRLELFGVRLGLETTRKVLTALGRPQRSFPTVLVTGTNGKGSTAALLSSMLTAAGYRTGLYTSPHLEEVEERVRIDGWAAEGNEFGERLCGVVEVAEEALGHPPTYFEALTATALAHFAENEVDLAVLEIGVGGRLDATNATEPVLSLITEIGRDHRRYLGDTLTAIAREKAGILRAGRPALAWVERREAWKAIRAVADDLGAHLGAAHELAEIGAVRPRPDGLAGQSVELRTPTGEYSLEVGLTGSHQARNLALAVLGAEALAAEGWPRLDGATITRGAARCRWPGRLELVRLPDGRRVLLDSAHNPDGARALAEFLVALGEPFDLLFGALADKEVDGILPPIAADATSLFLTAPVSGRALAPEKAAELVPARESRLVGRPADALSRALAEPGERLLVVCGSIYLVGEIRALLTARFGVPEPAAEMNLAGG